LTVRELGQLFADFNFRIFPVPQRIAIALDMSDVYIRCTNKLAERPFIAEHGGMELRAASLRDTSPFLVTQATLLRVVRGATEGAAFMQSNLAHAGDPNLTEDSFNSELDGIADFFTEFASGWGRSAGLIGRIPCISRHLDGRRSRSFAMTSIIAD
jgi:hypothetical protein